METVGVAATLMLTVLIDGAQVPLEMVHCRVEVAPMVKPVTPELNAAGVVTTAVPAVTVHNPVPTTGLLPARVVTVVLQRFWSTPALETSGAASTLMVTLLLVEGQTPLEIVHRKVDAAPGVSPVTPELNRVGVVTTPDPAVTVHAPVPGAGLFPARVDTVTLHRFWPAPALAVTTGLMVAEKLAEAAAQPPAATMLLLMR